MEDRGKTSSYEGTSTRERETPGCLEDDLLPACLPAAGTPTCGRASCMTATVSPGPPPAPLGLHRGPVSNHSGDPRRGGRVVLVQAGLHAHLAAGIIIYPSRRGPRPLRALPEMSPPRAAVGPPQPCPSMCRTSHLQRLEGSDSRGAGGLRFVAAMRRSFHGRNHCRSRARDLRLDWLACRLTKV